MLRQGEGSDDRGLLGSFGWVWVVWVVVVDCVSNVGCVQDVGGGGGEEVVDCTGKEEGSASEDDIVGRY